MKFACLEMLYLIWIIPVLFLVFFYGMHKRKKILSAFATSKALNAVRAASSDSRRWIKAWLIMIAMAFCVIALSGPQYGYTWREVERKGVDIIIALDCSRSMLAEDIQPTRLERAKREIIDLLNLLEGDRAGLVAFAGEAFLQCPLTLDYDAFNLFLNSLSPDFLPVGGTDIGGAIDVALSSFNEKDTTEKAIILITDGESTGGDPVKSAEAAQKAGVKLFCIGVGNAEGVPVPGKDGGFKKDAGGNIIMTRLDEDMLKKIAVMTGGMYVKSVAGDMDLDIIYSREIRGKMEASTLSSGKQQIWENRYQWFLIIAIIALIVEMLLPSVKKIVYFLLMTTIVFTSYSAEAAVFMPKNLKQGIEAYDKKDYETALDYFIKAQLDEPDRPEILYNIGNAYYKKGDYDSASKNYQKALATENKDLKQKAYYNLGNTDFRNGKYEDALSNYKSALSINPNDEEAKKNIEFVKKVMEKQKEEQQSSGDKDKKNNQDSQKSDQNTDQKTDPKNESAKKDDQKSDRKNDKSDKGNERDKDDDTQKKGKSDNEKQKQDASEPKNMNDENKTGDAGENKVSKQNNHAESGSPEDNEKAMKQADRILNRLQDKPGGAMMPSHAGTQVEKDW